MKRLMHLTAGFAALLALSTPAAQAGGLDGINVNGPALDRREMALPDGLRIGAPEAEEAQRIATNGPALDGREVALPDGLRIGAPAAEEAQRIATNGPALHGRRAATPGLAGLAINQLRLPSGIWGIGPADQPWTGSAEDQPLRP